MNSRVTVSEVWTACIDPEMSEVYRLLGNPGDRGNCWGCRKIGRKGAISDVRAWDNLTKLYYENIGRSKPVELAKQLWKYFEDQIRGPANQRLQPGQEPVPEWRSIDIYLHMSRHTNEPVLRTNHMINNLNRMLDYLNDYGIWERNQTFSWMARPRSSGIKDMEKLLGMIMRMYGSNPERMFGASQNSALASSTAIRSWVNPNKPSYGGGRSHPERLTESSA